MMNHPWLLGLGDKASLASRDFPAGICVKSRNRQNQETSRGRERKRDTAKEAKRDDGANLEGGSGCVTLPWRTMTPTASLAAALRAGPTRDREEDRRRHLGGADHRDLATPISRQWRRLKSQFWRPTPTAQLVSSKRIQIQKYPDPQSDNSTH